MRHKPILVSILILIGILFLTRCMNDTGKTSVKSDEPFSQFAGSQSCSGCHKDIYEKHLRTEHHHTSELPTDQSISGSFEEGKNMYSFDMLQKIRMEKRDSD